MLSGFGEEHGLGLGDTCGAVASLSFSEAGWKEYDVNDWARSGGKDGRETEAGAMLGEFRVRCGNVFDVGDVCGERRRAKVEMGVHESGTATAICSEVRLGKVSFSSSLSRIVV